MPDSAINWITTVTVNTEVISTNKPSVVSQDYVSTILREWLLYREMMPSYNKLALLRILILYIHKQSSAIGSRER